MMAEPTGTVDVSIFTRLQENIDQDVAVREELRTTLQELEKQGRVSQSILAKAHSTPGSQLPSIVSQAEQSVRQQVPILARLADTASRSPYYKYNQVWSRDVQDTRPREQCFAALYCAWLGGFGGGRALLSIDEVGAVLQVPVNLKDDDAFHLSIEEYLQALISLVDELARLAVNSVTLGDYERPLRISQFVKDVHAGFQILNLKNDSLRRRSDSLKYSVKKVEDVVYDLSLRNLVPRP